MALIYIIEDDIDLGVYIQSAFEEAGHRVSLFRLASDAIEAFQAQPSDVVVADMIIRDHGRVLPDGGLSAIWRIRQISTQKRRKVFIVAISGSTKNAGMENILTTADLMGADSAMAKPFDPEDLLYVVEKGLTPQNSDDDLASPTS